MSNQRSTLFLGFSLFSLFLLVFFVLLLVWREKTPGIPLPIEEISKAADVSAVFPASFGRLDDLVPYAGGIAPVAMEVPSADSHGAEFRDAAWVKAQSPDVYTLQVMAARDEATVRSFLAAREGATKFVYFLNPQDGSDWYVVTTGSFASREIATGVADGLDFGQPSKAFAKRMGVYQDAIAAATLHPAQAAMPATAEPVPPLAPPVNAPAAP